jgi:hypothetical protein
LQTIDKIIIVDNSHIIFKHTETDVYSGLSYIIQTDRYTIKTTDNSNVLADCLMICRDKIYESLILNYTQLNTLCSCGNPYEIDYIHLTHIINITSTVYNKKYLIKYKPECNIWQRMLCQNSNDRILVKYNLPVLTDCSDKPSNKQHDILFLLDSNYNEPF